MKTPKQWVHQKQQENHIQFQRIYFRTNLNIADALFLQDLINRASLSDTVWDDNGEWFLCTNEFLWWGGYGWSRRQQDRHISSLKRSGILSTKRERAAKGKLGPRWINLVVRQIQSKLDSAQRQLDHAPKRCMDHAPKRCIKKNTIKSKEVYVDSASRNPTNTKRRTCDMSRGSIGNGAITVKLQGCGLLGLEDKTGPSPIDLDRAQRLREINKTHKGVFVSRSPKRWGLAFRNLRKRLGADESKIDAALDYLSVPGCSFVVFDGASLATPATWNVLMDKMKKQRTMNPEVTVSREATDIAKTLKPLYWPAGSESKLPQFIQICLNNCRQFTDAIKPLTANPTLGTFARHIRSIMIPTGNYVQSYVRKVHKSVKGWNEWNGNIFYYNWMPQCELVDADGKGWAQKFGVRQSQWNQICDAVKSK